CSEMTETTVTAPVFATSGAKLDTWDVVTIVLYFVFVIAVGLFAMCRANRGTISGYFLAGRTMLWFPVGASLFVSNIGSEHFIGLAGSGAAIGIATGAWEVNALILIQLLGFVFAPIYITSGVVTMPEYLSKRFGGRRLRVFMAVLSLLLYIFTKVSVNLYSGGLFIQQSLGWNIYLSMIGLILITALLTITGGLAAVIYTDTLQAVLMISGATALTVLSELVGILLKPRHFKLVTNMTFSLNSCFSRFPERCGYPLNDSFVMLREPTDPNVPWPGFIFGQTPASIWYWCADQVIVQRALAAKSLSHAQGATIFAGLLKILPLFIMVMPGLISRILYTDEVACVDPAVCYSVCQSESGCSNIAFPRLVLGVMPTGARGLMMSVMIAALMSDLDSIFNSSSTIFTIDIWKRAIRPKCSVREMMLVGRVWVLVMVGLSIAWVPVMLLLQDGQLFLTIQEISGYLSPPIAAIFLLGVFWTRCNEQGAFWGMMAGFVVGIVRMIIVFSFQSQAGNCLVPDQRPQWYHDFITKINFMYYAIIIFMTTIIVAIIVSLFTEKPSKYLLHRSTWWTRHWTSPRTDNLEEELAMTILEEKPTTESIVVEESRSKMRRAYDWFCGFSATEGTEGDIPTQEELRKITSIHQDPRAKRLLQVLLVAVISAGVYMFGYFG
uniref:Sodium/myo-inositol cotransporter n=1 Tax=Ciona savignyi TaxID=51511 RepID=H2YMH3_CIOSA